MNRVKKYIKASYCVFSLEHSVYFLIHDSYAHLIVIKVAILKNILC
jgi:hypothetical protein